MDGKRPSTNVSTLEPVVRVAEGEGSYSRNSSIQAYINKIPLLLLHDALERVTLPSENGGPVVVADLGSSSGQNAVDNVAVIVEKLRQRLSDDAEFQVYLNDLPSLDFNNLFQLLTKGFKTKNFYAGGIAGSYFDRLCAESSVHVFHSSLCLHWLSKVPDEVTDRNSAAYNEGKLWLSRSSPAVATAYQQQALLDLTSFLMARATELLPGGLLFFSFYGKSCTEQNEGIKLNSWSKFQGDLNEVWSDLVVEGLLSEHQRDTFNIPVYLRSIEDVTEAITSCDSFFEVLTAKVETLDFGPKHVFEQSEPAALARYIAGAYKAVLNELLEAHVGKTASEAIWQQYEKRAKEQLTMNGDAFQFTDGLGIVSLIRK